MCHLRKWHKRATAKQFYHYNKNIIQEFPPMTKVNLTDNELQELKYHYVDRLVDNMSTKDLVQYVFDDMTRYVDNQSDVEFLEDAQNYWDDSFDEVVEEIKEFTDCDFKKPIEDRNPSNIFIDINNTGGKY